MKKRIDADHRGMRITGFWWIVEGILLLLLMVETYLYRHYG